MRINEHGFNFMTMLTSTSELSPLLAVQTISKSVDVDSTVESATQGDIVALSDDTVAGSGFATSTTRLKPFCFNDRKKGKEKRYLKLCLLQCVKQRNTHLAGYGSFDAAFLMVLGYFVWNIPERL